MNTRQIKKVCFITGKHGWYKCWKKKVILNNFMGDEKHTLPQDKSIKSASFCFSLPTLIYIFTRSYRFYSTTGIQLKSLDKIKPVFASNSHVDAMFESEM